MLCIHKYEYIGKVKAYRWLFGVVNGILVEVMVDAKKCKKCGKVKKSNG